MKTPICRVEHANNINFTGPMADHTLLDSVISTDRRYGVMLPRNGRYFTFRIIDTNDNEVTEKMLNQAVKLAWKSWTLRLDIDVRQAKPNQKADFTIYFRTPENDERGHMKKNTIMYHFFPIGDYNHPDRGVCVINPNFHFTSHGKPVSMHLIDPEHYDRDTIAKGSTIDLDAVLRHEFGHALGLPHDPVPHNTMSTPYNVLSEFLKPRDIARGIAKYGERAMPESRLRRWLRWLFRKSES